MTQNTSDTHSKTAKKEENSLRDFVMDAPGYLYMKNQNSEYLAANKEFLEIAGLNSLSELIGKTDRDLPWKERYDEYRKNDIYVMETGEIIGCEETVKMLDGSYRTFMTVKKPLKDNNDKIIGVNCNSLDITENKKIEALRKDKEISEKTIKFMEMLARNIAYELRTPLSIIKLNIDLLESSYFSNKIAEPEKEAILAKTLELIKRIIHANTYVLENILISLRNLVHGKIDNKNFSRLSIVENIEDTMAHYPFEDEERSLVEWYKLQNFEYIGDDLLTRHVLFNLIKNALHAIKEAGKGKITIDLKKNDDFNQLIFKDTALGISADYLPKIFDHFESNAPLKTGSGLGLSFCKMIMQAYGGDITCNSQEGEFAEFTLSFPKVNGEQGNLI